MTTPPLLMIAEGRRARPRKAPVERPKEITLHMGVAKLLRDYARPGWQWTHIPGGELRDVRTAAKLRQMGTRRGWPDFLLLSPAGLAHGLELKRLGEGLKEDQEAFAAWCAEHGAPHAVAFSIDEALAALDRWGALRLKLTGATDA